MLFVLKFQIRSVSFLLRCVKLLIYEIYEYASAECRVTWRSSTRRHLMNN